MTASNPVVARLHDQYLAMINEEPAEDLAKGIPNLREERK